MLSKLRIFVFIHISRYKLWSPCSIFIYFKLFLSILSISLAMYRFSLPLRYVFYIFGFNFSSSSNECPFSRSEYHTAFTFVYIYLLYNIMYIKHWLCVFRWSDVTDFAINRVLLFYFIIYLFISVVSVVV